MTSADYFRAIRLDELPHGAKRAIDIEGRSILLCKWGERIYAVSNICSHAQEKLEGGKMANGWIACPTHGARFDLVSGRAKNPPATRPIAVYGVRIVDDWIEIGIE
jgi:3-phenylpropionate/trans-cinnamate dioxygenase ferredoxin subunit